MLAALKSTKLHGVESLAREQEIKDRALACTGIQNAGLQCTGSVLHCTRILYTVQCTQCTQCTALLVYSVYYTGSVLNEAKTSEQSECCSQRCWRHEKNS